MDIFVNKNTVYNNLASKVFQAQCEFARSLLSPCFDLLKL